MSVREAAVNAIPIVKPAGPETVATVDGKLAQLASLLTRTDDSEERERIHLSVDRLLDVRLAIVRADNGDLA